MGSSVSKYFDDLEDKKYWETKEKEKKKSKINLLAWLSNLIAKYS